MNNSFKPFILPQDKVSAQTNPNVQPQDHIGAGSFLQKKYEQENSVQTPPEKTFSQRMTDITDTQNAEIQKSADLYKSGQQNIFSTVFQTLGSSAKAALRSFSLPVTVAFEKGMDTAGSLIQSGREAQKQADDEAIRLGKLDPSQALSRKPKLEDQLSQLIQNGATSDTVQKIRSKYDTLSPEAKANVGALGDFAQAFLDGVGTASLVKPVAKFTVSAGEKAFDLGTSKFITRKAEDIVDNTNNFISKVGAPFQPKTQEELVGRILQGKTEDIPLGKIALENIDTKGVNTFKTLNDRIHQTVPKFAQVVDQELGKDATRYSLDQLKVTKTAEDIAKDPLLSKITSMGGGGVTGEPVKVDFVTKALTDLSELYAKTSDPVAKQAVDNALKVAQKQGLTRQEVNDLARLYGSEFSNKAFSKTGEALTSVVGQAVENTRMGLKEIARQGLGGAEAKSADAVLESFYNTQRLLQKNIEAVNKARQKFTDRSLREMIGRGLGKTIDSISGGSIKAFLGGFLPRGVGNLEATWVDLEEALKYNLKLFERAGEDAKSAEESAKIIKDGFNSANPELQTITGTAKKVGADVKSPTTKTPTFTEGGIYTVPEKQQIYKDVIAPQIGKLGKIAPDETVVYFSGDGKAGQFVNTKLDGVWGYNAEDLKVMKVKTADLVSTGDTGKDGVGYRIFAKDLSPKQVNDVKVNDIVNSNIAKKEIKPFSTSETQTYNDLLKKGFTKDEAYSAIQRDRDAMKGNVKFGGTNFDNGQEYIPTSIDKLSKKEIKNEYQKAKEAWFYNTDSTAKKQMLDILNKNPELANIEKLPNGEFKVYQGTNDGGLSTSWTTNKRVAEKFGEVEERTVTKKDIFANLDNSEAEVWLKEDFSKNIKQKTKKTTPKKGK